MLANPDSLQTTHFEIQQARYPEDHAEVLAIFREYVLSPTVDLSFQEYETEFAALPGSYAAPRGRLLLAREAGRVVACACLRPINHENCEMKRVYVRPAARGQGLGKYLVLRLLEEARQAGYRRIHLDVLPEFKAAQALYRRLGFTPSPAVGFNPVPGTLFLSRWL